MKALVGLGLPQKYLRFMAAGINSYNVFLIVIFSWGEKWEKNKRWTVKQKTF